MATFKIKDPFFLLKFESTLALSDNRTFGSGFPIHLGSCKEAWENYSLAKAIYVFYL